MERRLFEPSGPRDREIGFGPYRLTADGQLGFPDNTRIQLSPRLACILFALAAEKGVAVSRLDLAAHCWTDDTIGEDNLTRAIADLRKIFRAHGEDCIETVYGLGYRLNTGHSDFDARDAISFCQEAWYRAYQRQRATLDSAENLFAQVVDKYEEYLPAWLGLAETQIHRMQLCYSTAMEAAPKAREALDHALAVDPTCADALALKGLLLSWVEWDFAGAEEVLGRACELDRDAYIPNQATAWHELAVGKLESAEHHFKVASAARPLSMTAQAGRAFARMYIGDTISALTVARDMVRIDPHGAVSQGLAAIFEAALGAPTEAVSMAEQSFQLLPESPVSGAILAYALARAGRAEQAKTLLESETKDGSLIGMNTMASPAWVELGESRLALAALESGFATRCTWLLTLLNDPRLDSLDCEPLRAAIHR